MGEWRHFSRFSMMVHSGEECQRDMKVLKSWRRTQIFTSQWVQWFSTEKQPNTFVLFRQGILKIVVKIITKNVSRNKLFSKTANLWKQMSDIPKIRRKEIDDNTEHCTHANRRKSFKNAREHEIPSRRSNEEETHGYGCGNCGRYYCNQMVEEFQLGR